MVLVTAAQLVEALRRWSLVDPTRLAEAQNGLGDAAMARTLADKLQRRGWLTSFQAEQLLEGRGHELVLGPFIVLDRLGKGGMGEVFKASHTRLGRIVALKVIRPEHLKYPGVAERFEREARAAARLQHPNVVTIHDVQDTGGTLYIAMELIDGIDLSRLVKQNGPLAVAQACEYARQAALGLQHAYERDLVHRDIKPSNLMVTRLEGTTEAFGLVKILDFGLARVSDEGGGSETLTPTDQWLGTPDYIAPEQARNSKGVDIRADIYSLGCALYFFLTGRSPFAGGNRVEKLVARLEREAPPASHHRPQVPARLDAVLSRMMARAPEARYATPLDVARALEPFCTGGAQPPTNASDQPTVSTAHGSDGRTLGRAEHDVASNPTPHDLASSPTPSISPWTPTLVLPATRQRRRRRRGVLIGLGAVVVLAAAIPLIVRRGEPSKNGVGPGGGQAKSFVNSIGMKLVYIPAGSFMMGSPEKEPERSPDEGPQHKVEIKKPFWMGVYEVTQDEFMEVMGRNPSHFAALGAGAAKIEGLENPGRLPVESMTWEDAAEFCVKLSKREEKEGRTYRLPTEAEWEYACRANTTGPFWLGEGLSADQANFNGHEPYNAPVGKWRQCTMPVGSFKANPFGLFDMHGNVWERCSDHYSEYSDNFRIPEQPDGGHVMRGGAFNNPGAECRSARRANHDDVKRENDVGFRVVCEP